jgi:protocatechuate 3,4-dioxygenase, alpha subunit
LTETPGQTIGPFFGTALPYQKGNELVPPGTAGAIQLHGVITDGDGRPVPDALVEIWQADADGRIPVAAGSLHRDGWTFTGWGRAETDDEGRYSFSTLMPGAAAPDEARFIGVIVFARGLLNRLFTRAYLPDTQPAKDRLLAALPAERRHTLITERDRDGLRFDIRLQGTDETVFLRYRGH